MAQRILLLLILIQDVTCETAFPSPCIGSGDDDCQSKAHGNYPDCDDCHKFVTCLFDHRVDKSCTIPGTVYDRISGECRHDVSCGGDSLDQGTTTSKTTTSTTGPTTSPTTSVTTTLTTVPTTPTTTFSTITSTTVPSATKTSSASTSTTSIIPSKSTTTPSTIDPIPTSTNATSTTTTTTPTLPFSITNFAAQVLRVFDPILPTVTTTISTTSGTTTAINQVTTIQNPRLNALPINQITPIQNPRLNTLPINQVTPLQNPRLNALPINPLVGAATASPMTTSSQQTILLTTAEETLLGGPTTRHSTSTSASAFGHGLTLFGNIATSTSAPNGVPLQGQLTSSKYVKKDGGVHLVKQYRPKVYSSPCLALWDTCLYRSDGHYPSCSTCSTRVICGSGVKVERWCPSGTLYDRYSGRCRPWEFVKCFGI